jgi:hypothetical protein
MLQVAAIASVMEPGELVCPFVVLERNGDRELLDLEAETQDQAVERGWASLDECRERIDAWAMAREGLVADSNGKYDVLVVAAWAPGMDDAVVFTQRFVPTAQGAFAIVGPLGVTGTFDGNELARMKHWFDEGIAAHPKHELWGRWQALDE